MKKNQENAFEFPLEIKTKKVLNLKEVKKFLDELFSKHFVIISPNDSFKDLVNDYTEKKALKIKEANRLDKLMLDCKEICDKNGVLLIEIADEIQVKYFRMAMKDQYSFSFSIRKR